MSSSETKQLELEPIPNLEDIITPNPDSENESFSIDSEDKAVWAAKKILDAESRITHYSELAQEYKKRIDSWFQKAIKKETESSSYLKALIKPFIEAEVSKLSRSKTIHLPGVAIQLKKKPDRIDISDSDLALSFCEANHPDAVIIKKEISKSYLKDLLTKQGEIIPGSQIILGEQELYFKEED